MSTFTTRLVTATLAAAIMSTAATGPVAAGQNGKSARTTQTSTVHAVTVSHKPRHAKRHAHTEYTHVTRSGRDVRVDAPTTMVETRGRRVAVDAPFAQVERSSAGVYVRAPFVDLWVPRR